MTISSLERQKHFFFLYLTYLNNFREQIKTWYNSEDDVFNYLPIKFVLLTSMVHVMDGLRSTLIAPFYHFFGWLISWYNGSNMILTYDFMQFIWFSCVNYSILSPPIIHDSTQLISELNNISFWSKWILYVMIRYNDSNLQICSYYFLG